MLLNSKSVGIIACSSLGCSVPDEVTVGSVTMAVVDSGLEFVEGALVMVTGGSEDEVATVDEV